MKLKQDELAFLRAISMIDGECGHCIRTMKDLDISEETKKEHFWQPLEWIDPSLHGYYLGYDWDTRGYILEWRGVLKVNPNDSKDLYPRHRIHVITYTGTGYIRDCVKMLRKALKRHWEQIRDMAE